MCVVRCCTGDTRICQLAAVAQLVERVLGKDEVMGPSPISS